MQARYQRAYEALDMTLAEASAALGVTRETLSKRVNGRNKVGLEALLAIEALARHAPPPAKKDDTLAGL